MSPKVSSKHKEQRRHEILGAAKKVFERKGYEAASMKDIVEQSGKSFGGVYMYYSNKEEIFLDLLALMDQWQSERLDEPKSAWEALRAFLQMQQEELKQIREVTIIPAAYEFFLAAWREERRSSYMIDRYRRGAEETEALLKRGVLQGEFSPVLPLEGLVKLMLSTMEGMTVSIFSVGVEEIELAEQFRALEFLLHQALQVNDKSEGDK